MLVTSEGYPCYLLLRAFHICCFWGLSITAVHPSEMSLNITCFYRADLQHTNEKIQLHPSNTTFHIPAAGNGHRHGNSQPLTEAKINTSINILILYGSGEASPICWVVSDTHREGILSCSWSSCIRGGWSTCGDCIRKLHCSLPYHWQCLGFP